MGVATMRGQVSALLDGNTIKNLVTGPIHGSFEMF